MYRIIHTAPRTLSSFTVKFFSVYPPARILSLTDEHGLLALLKQCSSLKHLDQAYGFMVSRGLDHDNLLLSKFLKTCGSLDVTRYAFSIFSHKMQPDVYLYNTMIKILSQTEYAKDAVLLYNKLHVLGFRPDTYSFPFVLKAVTNLTALEVGREIHAQPDEIAMLAALSACAQLGALELGEWIHNYIDKQGLFRIVPLTNALIDMYAKSGNIRKALEVFENMRHRSVITWTTMIAGLALHGLGVEALEMFTRMDRARVRPNDVTFIAILSACSHVGLVDQGRWYFNIMESKYHIKCKIEHYGCLIDLLGRAGFLEEAQDLVKTMPFEANGAIWGSLLAASRIYGSVELGEHALRHLIEVEPHNSGNYTLLSNIYAAREKWEGVGNVRKMMRDSRVKKSPGGSSIEVNGTVHNFISGDKSHMQCTEIYEVLYVINYQLKLAGYVPKIWQGPLDLDEG
ncbi:hypothetical protein H6P81_003061 [Aristolochia fimbriata]|uniref:Pentatricopeptide repeat-containing protein n=1 Tax=Aristolochia fimbriata TaxID=158543 RepID=A0AAV7FG01_ARIFI|nr:hypothetical protein H6P81_003061 [Aristolochia fimbriata]